MIRVAVVSCAMLGWMSAPAVAPAQSAAPLTPVLADWSDQAWLLILDRNGGAGGRMSDKGVQRRFDPLIDDEYRIDLLTARGRFAELAAWDERDGGFRWRAGSISKRDLATMAAAKGRVSLGSSWTLGVRVDLEETPEAHRSFVRAAFTKRLGKRYHAFAAGSIDPNKPGSDLAVGGGWSDARTGASVGASLAILDWANDLIYINLRAARASEIDSTLVYERQPLAARAVFAVPLGAGVTVAGQAAFVRPSEVSWYSGEMPDSGVRQAERMGYAGGLVEWRVVPRVRVAAMGTYMENSIDRTRRSPGVSLDEFALTERTAQLGALGTAALGRAVFADLSLMRVWRDELRDNRTSPTESVDYADVTWLGALAFIRRPARGFIAELVLLYDLPTIQRGRGEPPGAAAQFDDDHWRASWNVGWNFSDRASFMLGSAVDLDGDGGGRRFDGMRGRFTVWW